MQGRWNEWWAFVARVRASRVTFFLLLVPNLIGILFGYYFYYNVGQFNPADEAFFRDYVWWPFIPDSPNAVLVCVVALAAYTFFGKRSRLLDGLAFTGMLYVGLWTTFLFLAYADAMGTFEWGSVNNLLFFSHMGMPLEAMLFIPALLKDKRDWLIPGVVAAWMALGSWLDYGPLNLHPAPFLHDVDHLPPLASVADIALHTWSPVILVGTLAAYVWFARLARPTPSAEAR